MKTEALETTKEDIERKLSIIGGDMLKIEYLENCHKKHLPLDVRKFVLINLANLYEKRLMFGEAAKNIGNAADSALIYREKKELYTREIELLIKNGSFLEAEDALNKALASANTTGEKFELKEKLKMFYLKRAEEFENARKLNNALKIYERLLASDQKNITVMKKLASLYNRVGKIKESIAMENSIKSL